MSREKEREEELDRRGRRAAVYVAAIAIFWVVTTWAGRKYGWTQQTSALFDLAALAAFGWALWEIIMIWRDRRKDRN